MNNKFHCPQQMALSTVRDYTDISTPEPPRGQKRNYSSIVRSPGGSYDCSSAVTCDPGCSCGESPDWRWRRRRDSGPDAAFSPAPAHASGCHQESSGQSRRSVIRSQTELMPTPPGAEEAPEAAYGRVPLPGPAGFTPPASVSPQEPPPSCGSPLGLRPTAGSPLGPRYPECGSPLGTGAQPYAPATCRSPRRLVPPSGDAPQGLHTMHLMDRTPIEALRPFWYVPQSP